jgi:hypothetical protein
MHARHADEAQVKISLLDCSGSLAFSTAMRYASSRVNSLAADRRHGLHV